MHTNEAWYNEGSHQTRQGCSNYTGSINVRGADTPLPGIPPLLCSTGDAQSTKIRLPSPVFKPRSGPCRLSVPSELFKLLSTSLTV